MVDPGHNGENFLHPEINDLVDIVTQQRACDTTGTETNDGYSEAEYNFDVASRLSELLRQRGASVVMTRPDNAGWGPCINERAAIGNRAHADVAISIHADGGPKAGRGFHVISPADIAGLTTPIYEPSKRVARAIHDTFALETPMPIADYVASDGFVERRDLGGLNLSTVPKVFIETGNMRNAIDASLLTSESYRQQAALALADGLEAYLMAPAG